MVAVTPVFDPPFSTKEVPVEDELEKVPPTVNAAVPVPEDEPPATVNPPPLMLTFPVTANEALLVLLPVTKVIFPALIVKFRPIVPA